MVAPRQLRVLIVEDSTVVRMLLQHIIEGDPRLTVAAAVASGEEALTVLPELRPDVISMDVNLPGMDGLEATRQIMATVPTPIVVISGAVERSALKSSMDALRAGALAVVEKPVGVSSSAYETVAREITTQLAIMSQVRVVRRRLRAGEAPLGGPTPVPETARPRARLPEARPRVLVCAASTGGPQALARLFGQLPQGWPLPILLVQHMGTAFMEGFARWLDSVVPLRVSIAREGSRPRPGCVHVAPGDRHLRISRAGTLALGEDDPIRSQRPAATALFLSAAEVYGAEALGVVLTGMGEDGAPGVEALVRAGAPVIAEAEESAVVYGMPAAAVRAGATAAPLDRIPEELVRLAGREAAA